MPNKRRKREPGKQVFTAVQKEMAKPRMARSARKAELALDTARIPERPSTVMLGTVDKIILSSQPSQPEKAQISIDGAEHRYRDIRIENTLTDEHGDDVRLKKGAHVDVIVTANALTTRSLVWIETDNFQGFGCSECAWVFKPSRTLVGETLEEMKRLYEAERDKEFAGHVCVKHPRTASPKAK